MSFELQYINGGWKPCVIYGSEGTPELSGFQEILENIVFIHGSMNIIFGTQIIP